MARLRGFPSVLAALTVGALTVTGVATFAATVTATGQFLGGLGSAGAPAYASTTLPTTGFYFEAGPKLLASVGGTRVCYSSGALFTFDVPVILPVGSAATPSVQVGSALTGFYSLSGRIALTLDGASRHYYFSDTVFSINSNSGIIIWGMADDLAIGRLGAASLRLGYVPSATPIAQTFTIGEASRPGTDTNVGGANGTIRSGLGTGTGTGSSLIFQTPTVVGSGSGVQTYETRLTLGAALVVTVPIQTPGATNINANGYFRLAGAGYMYAPSDGVFVLYNEANTSFGRLCFGGTSNGFPALRVGTFGAPSIEVVDASNSSFIPVGASAFYAAGVKVLGAQGAAVADASGGAIIDAEARTALNTLLARMRAHGLIAT